MIEPHSLENAHYFHKSFNTKIKYSAFVKTEVSVFLRWNNFQQGTRKKCTGMYYIYIYSPRYKWSFMYYYLTYSTFI